jgi:hypothetical protein
MFRLTMCFSLGAAEDQALWRMCSDGDDLNPESRIGENFKNLL